MIRPRCTDCGATPDDGELRQSHRGLACAICFGDDAQFEELPVVIEAPEPANINGGPMHAS